MNLGNKIFRALHLVACELMQAGATPILRVKSIPENGGIGYTVLVNRSKKGTRELMPEFQIDVNAILENINIFHVPTQSNEEFKISESEAVINRVSACMRKLAN
jgi:hypothetical protein